MCHTDIKVYSNMDALLGHIMHAIISNAYVKHIAQQINNDHAIRALYYLYLDCYFNITRNPRVDINYVVITNTPCLHT